MINSRNSFDSRNTQMSETKVRAYSFTAEGPEDYAIKVLVNPSKSWTGYYHAAATLSYCFPTASDYLKNISKIQGKDITEILAITNDATKSDMRTAFGYWQSVANITFVETDANDIKCQMPIYEFKQTPSKASGYAYAPFYDQTLGIMKSWGIGLNKNSYDNWFPRLFYPGEALVKTQTHESGHLGLTFNHGFSGNFKFQTNTENATTYSIMNYDKEKYAIYGLQPMMPMPHDIDAAQFVYGPNMQMGSGNDIYYFKNLTPIQGILSWLSLNKPVLTLPWDNGGVDTLSAAGIYDRHLIVDINPYGRSQVGNTILMTPNIEIENVIGGETNNNIILNALNNMVDVSNAADTSRIIVDPAKCGDDTIFGFKPSKDCIILRVPEGSDIPKWTVTAVEGAEVTLADNTKTYQSGTKIQFGDNNSVVLADVKPSQITTKTILVKSTSEVETLLWDLSEYLPKELAKDFAAAFFSGSAIALLLGINEQVMKRYACTDKQIAAVNTIASLALILATGQTIPSVVGMVTSTILGLMNCSNSTRQTISTMMTLGARAALTVSTPDQVLNLIATLLGSAVGTKVTSTVINKIAEVNKPSLLQPHTIESSFYKRGRNFTLWACSKLTACCRRASETVDETTASLQQQQKV